MITACKRPTTTTTGIEKLEAVFDAGAARVDVGATVTAAVGAAVPVAPAAGTGVDAAGDPVASDAGVGAYVGTATCPTPKKKTPSLMPLSSGVTVCHVTL